jgi:hypothetical protein
LGAVPLIERCKPFSWWGAAAAVALTVRKYIGGEVGLTTKKYLGESQNRKRSARKGRPSGGVGP